MSNGWEEWKRQRQNGNQTTEARQELTAAPQSTYSGQSENAASGNGWEDWKKQRQNDQGRKQAIEAAVEEHRRARREREKQQQEWLERERLLREAESRYRAMTAHEEWQSPIQKAESNAELAGWQLQEHEGFYQQMANHAAAAGDEKLYDRAVKGYDNHYQRYLKAADKYNSTVEQYWEDLEKNDPASYYAYTMSAEEIAEKTDEAKAAVKAAEAAKQQAIASNKDWRLTYQGGSWNDTSAQDEEIRKAKEQAEVWETALEQRKSNDLMQSYKALTEAPDFEEKSKFVSSKNGKEEKFHALSGTYTETGYDDILHDAINGDENAQNKQRLYSVYSANGSEYSNWYKISDEDRKIYNYLYNTGKKDEAREYVEMIAGRNYSPWVSLGFGFAQGIGASSLTEAAANALGGDERMDAVYKMWSDAQKQNQTAYGVGNMAGNIALMAASGQLARAAAKAMGLGGAKVCAVSLGGKTFAVYTTPVATKMATSAMTFALTDAVQNLGSASAGRMTVGEYLGSLGKGAAGGAAGSLASWLVDSKMAALLADKGWMTAFGEYTRKVAASAAFSTANIGTKQILSSEKMSVDECGRQMLTSFLYSIISSGLQTIAETQEYKAGMDALKENIANAYNRMSTEGLRPAEKAELAQNVVQWTEQIKTGLNSMYLPGQQQYVDDMNAALDGMIELMDGYGKFNADWASQTGPGGMIGSGGETGLTIYQPQGTGPTVGQVQNEMEMQIRTGFQNGLQLAGQSPAGETGQVQSGMTDSSMVPNFNSGAGAAQFPAAGTTGRGNVPAVRPAEEITVPGPEWDDGSRDITQPAPAEESGSGGQIQAIYEQTRQQFAEQARELDDTTLQAMAENVERNLEETGPEAAPAELATMEGQLDGLRQEISAREAVNRNGERMEAAARATEVPGVDWNGSRETVDADSSAPLRSAQNDRIEAAGTRQQATEDVGREGRPMTASTGTEERIATPEPQAPARNDNIEGGLNNGTAAEGLADRGQRDAGLGAGGQTGSLGESTGGPVARSTSTQERNELKNYVKALGADRASARDLGIRNGSRNASNVLIDVEALTGALKDRLTAMRAQAEEAGVRLDFVTGKMELRVNGQTANNNGVFQIDADGTPHLFVQADSRQFTPEQIYEHEIFHALVAGNKALWQDILQHLKETHTTEEIRAMVDAYASAYDGCYGYEAGAEDLYLEELMADVYAEMQRGGALPAAARKLAGETAQRFAGDIENARQNRAGIDNRNGPGTRLSFAGQNAQTADAESLEEAKRLLADGADSETVRQQTGWFRGMDGKWRFEIDDSGMEFRKQGDMQSMQDPEYREYLELWDKVIARMEGTETDMERLRELDKRFSGVGRVAAYKLREGTATLPDIIQHDALFEAYPMLRNIRVQFAEMKPGVNASYDKKSNTIKVSYALQSAPEGTLIHEIQHAIQGIEEFAGGANTGYWKNQLEAERRQELSEAEKEVRRLFDAMPDEVQNRIREYNRANLNRDYDLAQEIEDQLYDDGYGKTFSDYIDAQVYLDLERRRQSNHDINEESLDLYARTAGEVEARDAAARRSMTAEERKNTRPDIDREDVVFARGETSSSDMANAPKKGLPQATINSIQQIGEKSVNQFSSQEIQTVEPLARQYWNEMGTKSPFFRAWFGDWRQNDDSPVSVAKTAGSARGVISNDDTGWDINISGQVFNETNAHQASGNRGAVPYLPYIEDIVKKAILLDTNGMRRGKAKSQNSLLMHSLYAVADIGNGPEVLKLYVEEMNTPGSDRTAKRAYQLQNIEKAFAASVRVQGLALSSITNTTNAISTVADLFDAVKRYDPKFQPNVPSKIVDPDGNPLQVYHGTESDFTVFEPKKTRSRMDIQGMFFSPWEIDAAGYGSKVGSYFLNIKNPAPEHVAMRVLNRYKNDKEAGSKARDALVRMGYDGVEMQGTEFIAFDSNQVKSATDNIGTFDTSNPDVRFSAADEEDVGGVDWLDGSELEETSGPSRTPAPTETGETEKRIATGPEGPRNDNARTENGGPMRAYIRDSASSAPTETEKMAAEVSGHYEALAREKKIEMAERLGIDGLKSRIKTAEERLKMWKAMQSSGLVAQDANSVQELKNRIADAQETLEIFRAELVKKQDAKKVAAADKDLRAARKAERAAEKKALAKEAELKDNKPRQARREFREDALNLFSVQAGKRQTLGNIINSFADRLIAQGSVSEADRAELFRQLYEAGVEVVQADEYHRNIRETVDSARIYVPDSVRAEFGDDWNDFRQKAWGNGVYLTNSQNDRGADSWNAELAEMFPGSFDAGETDARTMLENIVDLAEEGKAEFVSLPEMMQRNQAETGVTVDQQMDELERKVDHLIDTFAQKADLEIRTRKQGTMQLVKERQKNREMAARQVQRQRENNTRNEVMKQLQQLNRMRKKSAPEIQRQIDDIIGNLDTMARSISPEGMENLQALARKYSEAAEDPNFLGNPYVEARLARLSQTQLDDLEISDVIELGRTISALVKTVTEDKRLLTDAREREISDAAKEVNKEIKSSAGSKGGKLREFLGNEHLSPTRELQRLGGWVRGGMMEQLSRSLEDGGTRRMEYMRQATRIFDDFLSDKANQEWLRKAQGKDAEWITITAKVGVTGEDVLSGEAGPKVFKDVTFELTPMMRVGLLMHSKNKDNLRHIETGGIVIPDKECYIKGNLADADAKGLRVKIQPEIVRAIVKDCTAQEKAFAALLEKYYDGFSKEKINEVSMLIDGFERAGGDHYYGIKVSRKFLAALPEQIQKNMSLESIGSIVNERVHAGNPIVLEDASTALKDHIDLISKYYGYTAPIRDFNAVMNYTFHFTAETKGGGEYVANAFSGSVKETLQAKWGSGAQKYIDDLLADLQQSSGINETAAAFLAKLRGNLAGASLMFNPAVAISQTASLPGAIQVVGFDGMVAGLKPEKVDMNLVEKYTPILWYRNQGNSTQELGDYMARQRLEGKLPWFFNWIQKMDSWTIRRLWAAAEYRVSKDTDLAPGSKAQIDAGEDPYYQEVARVFQRAVYDTQPNYSEMQRPAILRSKSDLTKMLTMYKTVPLQYYNMMYEAVGRLKADKARFEADGSAANKAQFEQSRSFAVRTFAGVLGANVVYVVMKAAVKGLLAGKDDRFKDEEGKFDFWKSLGGLGKDLMETYAGSVIFGSELLSGLEKLYSAATTGKYSMYGGLEISALGAVEDTLGGLYNLAKELYKQDLTGGLGAIKDLAKQLAMDTGIPANNIETYLMGTAKWFAPEWVDRYENFFDEFERADLKGEHGRDLRAAISVLMDNRTDGLKDETIDELMRLWETGQNAVIPSAIPSKVSVDGEDVEIKGADKAAFRERWGQVIDGSLEKLLASDAYQAADDAGKAKLISKLYEYARQQAAAAVTDKKVDAWVEFGQACEAAGIPLDQYLSVVSVDKSKLKDMDGEALDNAIQARMEFRVGELDENTLDELGRLYAAGGTGAIPADVPTSVSVSGEENKLTAEERVTWLQAWKRTAGENLEALMASKAYAKADDAGKAKLISALYDMARASASSEVVAGYEPDKWISVGMEAKERGVPLDEYAAFHVGLSGLKTAEKMDLLKSQNWTEEQKELLWSKLMASESQMAKYENLKNAGMKWSDAMERLGIGEVSTSSAGLTDAQQVQYDKYFSDISGPATQRLLNNTTYRRADKATQAAYLDRLNDYAARIAKGKVLSGYDKGKWVECGERLTAAGVKLDDYVVYYEGTSDAKNRDKYDALVKTGWTDSQKLIALEYISSSTYSAAKVCTNYQINLDLYLNGLAKADADQSGNISQAEAEDYLDGLSIGREEKAYLWQLLSIQSKWKNNPYSAGYGEEIWHDLHPDG